MSSTLQSTPLRESILLTSLFCRKTSTRYDLSDSAPKSCHSGRSTTTTPTKSPFKEQQTYSKLTNDPERRSHADESHSHEHFANGDGVIDHSHRNSSLPLWAHRFGCPQLDPSRHGTAIDIGGFKLANPPPSDHLSAKVNGLNGGDNGTDARLIGSSADGPSVAEHQHEVDDPYGLRMNFHLLDETWHHRWSGLSIEHLQHPTTNYQLGIWVHSTINTEITLTERMEKYNWEGSCLQRL